MMEKSRRLVWESFFQAPLTTVKLVTNDYNERFALITGENINLEQGDEENQYVNEESNGEEVSKPDSDKNEKSEEGDHGKGEYEKSDKESKGKEGKGHKNKHKVLPYDPKKRKIIGFKLAIFFIIGVVYFYLIFYTGFQSL